MEYRAAAEAAAAAGAAEVGVAGGQLEVDHEFNHPDGLAFDDCDDPADVLSKLSSGHDFDDSLYFGRGTDCGLAAALKLKLSLDDAEGSDVNPGQAP